MTALSPIQIGNLKIERPLFLAPMAGVTDHPFRVIAREMGAGVVYTEFVSADGIIRKIDKSLKLIRFTEDERPIGIQIFGHDPETVAQSARMIVDMYHPDIVDINYGCPVPKVVKRGAGSGALRDLCLMDEMTSAVLEAVPEVPVTIKMRAGVDARHIVSTEAAVRLEKLGVKAITLHPRTTSQQFTGRSNWMLIKEMKEAVKIPVIGNGDIRLPEDADRMLAETGCDGVMVGRAALGNPWIFRNIVRYFHGQSYTELTTQDRIRMCDQHFNMLTGHHNEIHSLNMIKKHFNWYLKGFPGAVTWRKRFMICESTAQVQDLLSELLIESGLEPN